MAWDRPQQRKHIGLPIHPRQAYRKVTTAAQRPWRLARRSLKEIEEPEYDPPQAEAKPRQQQWHDNEEDQGRPRM